MLLAAYALIPPARCSLRATPCPRGESPKPGHGSAVCKNGQTNRSHGNAFKKTRALDTHVQGEAARLAIDTCSKHAQMLGLMHPNPSELRAAHWRAKSPVRQTPQSKHHRLAPNRKCRLQLTLLPSVSSLSPIFALSPRATPAASQDETHGG